MSASSLGKHGSLVALSSNDSSAATGIDGDPTNNSAALAGASYLLTNTGGVLRHRRSSRARIPSPTTGFGGRTALSSDGTTFAVAASNRTNGAGAVYVFDVK